MTTTPSVTYWNNIPAPYMVTRFNALARRGNIDLSVWFNARTEADRHWEVKEERWNFRHTYIPHVTVRGRSVGLPPALLSRTLPNVLVSLHGELSFTVGWGIARKRGVRTALWVVKTFDSWTTRRAYKEALKRYIFSRTDGIFVPGADGREYALAYGGRDDSIFTLPHPLDDEFMATVAKVRPEKRDRVRSDLGLQGTCFLYVGRMWRGKGLESLLQAFGAVQAAEPHVSLMMVGEGDDRARLLDTVRREGLQNVRFLGFRQKWELAALYAACDAFVFPTLGDPYGLVVDEAMASGLPVISTSAAGEIRDRVNHGRTGFIVTPGDPGELGRRMLELAASAELRGALGSAGKQQISNRTLARWCSRFEDGVTRIAELRDA